MQSTALRTVARAFRFLKSIRLAVALIAWLAVSGAAATLVPQGEDGQFYRDRYPAPLASAMAAIGFTDFFRSWLFLAPAAVFFANLSTCAAARFLRQLRTRTPPCRP